MKELERTANFLPRTDAASPDPVDDRVVTLTAPGSNVAEQYRTLYYRLERMRELRTMKLLGFTSALSGEGKTLTSLNLALTASRADPERRVVLVDADLRRGRVARLLGIASRPGLSELLCGECELRDAVRRFQSTSLAVVPSGASPEDPARAVAGARMKALLRTLREHFDEAYIDLPPVLPFADAGIVGAQVDGLVMVIRASATPSKRVSQAIEALAGAPVIGCVLNGAEASAASYLKNELR